jgi:hypothetical protein
MSRGGPRPGAGRKTKAVAAIIAADNPKRIAKIAKSVGLTPLEYMLGVMNDAEADAARRDRMAQAAAPYVHAKPGGVPKGKKEQAEDDAQRAGQGTGWGDDLSAPASALN